MLTNCNTFCTAVSGSDSYHHKISLESHLECAGQTSKLARDSSAPDLQRSLLILHWDNYVVAVPVEFGGHVTHAQQAKGLIAQDTKQLIEVLQSLNSIISRQATADVR